MSNKCLAYVPLSAGFAVVVVTTRGAAVAGAIVVVVGGAGKMDPKRLGSMVLVDTRKRKATPEANVNRSRGSV